MSEASDKHPVYVDQKAYQDPDTFRNGTWAWALTAAEQETLLSWIRENFVAAKTPLKEHTSYTLKHEFERATWPQAGFYVTNGHFKGAMLAAGIEPVDPNEENWRFRIRRVVNRPKKGSFMAWLLKRGKWFYDRDIEHPIRWLAIQASMDVKFPNGETTKEEVRANLVLRKGFTESLEALDEAWEAYQQHLTRHGSRASRGSQRHASLRYTSPSVQ